MEKMRIIQLAYTGALELWAFAKEKNETIPDNEILEIREAKAWEELTEISNMLYKLEQKQARKEELTK